MKNKLLFLFFLLTSFTAQAGPGDDIWQDIRWLKDKVTDLQNKIASIPR